MDDPIYVIPASEKSDSCCAAMLPQVGRIMIPCQHDLEEGIMTALIIRRDRTSAVLRKLAKAEADTRVARRLLAIANALSGMSRKEAAEAAGMDRQTLRDWVIRYNAHGLDGLYDCWGDGRPPRLAPQEQAEFIGIVLKGPDTEADGFRRSRARILCAFAKPALARPSIRPRLGDCLSASASRGRRQGQPPPKRPGRSRGL